MGNWLMAGQGRRLISAPPLLWKRKLRKVRAEAVKAQGWLSPEHRRVHHFVVRELPRLAEPMAPDYIAQGVGLGPGRVREILAELEAHLFFLVNNEDGRIHWAYPVTVDQTPHKLTFSTGERLNAA